MKDYHLFSGFMKCVRFPKEGMISIWVSPRGKLTTRNFLDEKIPLYRDMDKVIREEAREYYSKIYCNPEFEFREYDTQIIRAEFLHIATMTHPMNCWRWYKRLNFENLDGHKMERFIITFEGLNEPHPNIPIYLTFESNCLYLSSGDGVRNLTLCPFGQFEKDYELSRPTKLFEFVDKKFLPFLYHFYNKINKNQESVDQFLLTMGEVLKQGSYMVYG